MRTAREEDVWNAISKRKFKYGIQSINLNGLLGINEIVFNEGIIAICGLNGAGKSTIISAIKDIIGIPKSNFDTIKIGTNKVIGKFKSSDFVIECENQDTKRVIDNGIDQDLFNYIDYERITKTQLFFTEQTNLDELIEQNEELMLGEKDIKEICYIVGKHYDSCSIREIEDVNDLGTLPFFTVKIDGMEYDSTKMGIGEHFIFYLFWLLYKLNKDSIVIIEEPETFISISSQENLINYIAYIIEKKGIEVIITTHSPYILKRIKNENIRIISRLGNNTRIYIPKAELTVEALLGIKQYYYGTFFVEDKVAKEFLVALLEDRAPNILKSYRVEIAEGGETEISERLAFKYSDEIKYIFVGIYDGDMKEKIDPKNLNWPYCFLPLENAVEYEFRKYLRNNISQFCNVINKSESLVMTVLSKIDGMDYHDWFIEFCKELSLEHQFIIKQYYILWKTGAAEYIDVFLNELYRILNIENS